MIKLSQSFCVALILVFRTDHLQWAIFASFNVFCLMNPPKAMRSPSTGLAQYEIQGRHPNPLSWNESQIQRLLLKTLSGSTVILRILAYTESIPSYLFPHMSSGNWHGYSNIRSSCGGNSVQVQVSCFVENKP